MSLPMNNSSSQAIQAMSVDKVENFMPNPQLRRLLDGDVDIILGITYNSVHPEVIHTTFRYTDSQI